MKSGTRLALAHLREMEQEFDSSESNIESYDRLLRAITETGATYAATMQSPCSDQLNTFP
jgi:hypothetical protein